LYERLLAYVQKYLGELQVRLSSFSGQLVLARYFDESAHYMNAARVTDYIFRYLNRHWIQRELDEGHGPLYDVYTLHLVLWHSELFSKICDNLVDAISELVKEHRVDADRETDRSQSVQLLLESIDLLQSNGLESSGSMRDCYGSLLENPWRIAIESCHTKFPPVFRYPTPTTMIPQSDQHVCDQLNDQLASLTFYSGTDPLKHCGSENAVVKLITTDGVVVEVGKLALASTSCLIY